MKMTDPPAQPVENELLMMVRRHLADLPRHALPDGYAIRWYEPGDDQTWYDVQRATEPHHPITPDLHAREFGDDENVLARRQAFLHAADGQAIGTASAWFDEDFHGELFGRIHWVAITPPSRSRRLSSA